MTHGHELRLGSASGRGDAGWRGVKGWKKWDNYNSIINKIYLKIKKKKKKENGGFFWKQAIVPIIYLYLFIYINYKFYLNII